MLLNSQYNFNASRHFTLLNALYFKCQSVSSGEIKRNRILSHSFNSTYNRYKVILSIITKLDTINVQPK